MNLCMHVCMYACMPVCLYARTDGCIDVWMYGCMYGWMDGWMYGFMDVWRYVWNMIILCVPVAGWCLLEIHAAARQFGVLLRRVLSALFLKRSVENVNVAWVSLHFGKYLRQCRNYPFEPSFEHILRNIQCSSPFSLQSVRLSWSNWVIHDNLSGSDFPALVSHGDFLSPGYTKPSPNGSCLWQPGFPTLQ